MKKYIIIFLSVFLLIVSYSCKTSKPLESPSNKDSDMEYNTNVSNLLNHQFSFDWLSAKLSAVYQGTKIGGQLRMKKDSVIWMSLNVFGLEVGRIKATQDSVFVVVKKIIDNDEYFAGDYSIIEQISGVKINFNILEALLLGNDFKCFDIHKCKIEDTSEYINLFFENRYESDVCTKLSKQSRLHFRQLLTVSKANYRIIQNVVSPIGTSNKLQVDYLRYQMVENRLLPLEINILFASLNESGSIKLNLQDPVLGKVQTFPFTISSKAVPLNF